MDKTELEELKLQLRRIMTAAKLMLKSSQCLGNCEASCETCFAHNSLAIEIAEAVAYYDNL